MKNCALKIDTAIEPLRRFSSCILSPLLDLGIRLFMANIFFASGWLKFQNYLNGHWSDTVGLFEYAHPIPGVPPSIAAVAGTAGELALSSLLALGLFGRFAAAGLLVMTLVIQFLVPAEYDIMNPDHYFWMLLLAVIFVKGPGRFSADWLLLKLIRKENTK